MPATRTRIDAGHVIAYRDGGHRYLRDGVVVVEGNQIVHVGPTYDGPSDEQVDARTMLVTPGLINTHAHLAGSPLDKSFVEDRGRRQFYNSGLFEYLPVRGAAQDEAASRACVDYSMAEILRSGTTTVLEIGPLGRDDLGRIAPGAKADLLFFDTQSTWLTPLRDPIKNLVYSAQASDIHTVMVDGQIVVRDGKTLNVDEHAAARALQEAGERMWPRMSQGDWANRTADQLSPQSFPWWQEPD
jgi:cytosine/adenosine deaminase-related metal-dependent hydrolase